MKKLFKSAISFVFAFLFVFALASCGAADDAKAWESAIYKTDTELGSGAKTLILQVKVIEESVTLTVKTDKNTVGEALLEQGIIEGENGPYGLYVKVVNGITADYDIDGSWWSLTKDGELCAGVDSTEIADGDKFEFTYSK
jgi:hypothetical protein